MPPPLPPRPGAPGFFGGFRTLRFVPRFFRLIWSTQPRLAAANLGLRLLRSVLPVLQLYVGKLIIDQVVLQGGAAEADLRPLAWLVGSELALTVLSDLFGRATDLTDSLIAQLYSNRVSVELIRKSADLELRQLEDPEFYDRLERARRQTVARTNLMASVLSQVQDAITVSSLLVGLLVIQPWLLLLLLLAIVPSFLNELHFSRSRYALSRRWTPEQRELNYLAYIGATDESAKEVKLFDLSGYLSRRFGALASTYYEAHRRLSVRRAAWGGLFSLLGTAAYYVAYAVVIVRTVRGALSLGDLTFLAGSFLRLQLQVGQMFSRFTTITESAMYLEDYFDFLDMKVEADDPDRMAAPEVVREGLRFEDVGFAYPGRDEPVFRGLSFELRAGEKLALVGPNGAGKTTLIKLMLRLYEPTEGRILLDGVDIRAFDATSYRRLYGALFQDFVRYDFTAAENIGVGRVEAIEDLPRIREAARKGLADQVIDGLAGGYGQQLGRRFAQGTELSGGQWQKLALARAYMSDAPIIILDEPTAALDAQAEYDTFLRFVGLTEGKSAVIISHRFSTVRMADRIAVLEGGRLAQLGTHDELLASGGTYAALFELQARGYRT